MYCKNCGNELKEGETFCSKCGDNCVTESSAEIAKLKKSLKVRTIIIAVVAAVAVLFFILFLTKSSDSGMKSTTSKKSDAKVSEEVYEASTDLTVKYAFINKDSEAYIVVENTGSEVITDYEVAILGFDSTGNVVKIGYDNDYEESTVSSANIMPGKSYGADKEIYIGNDQIKYIRAAVSSVTFKNGETWNAENKAMWAEKTESDFSVEAQKQYVESLEEDAAKAETNDYIEITKITKTHENQFSDKDNMSADGKNIGDKTVKNFVIAVLEYDDNGYSVGSTNNITDNLAMANVQDANLNAGDSGSWYWSLLFDADCSKYKYIVSEIEFMDGTTWTNDYYIPWIICNCDNY